MNHTPVLEMNLQSLLELLPEITPHDRALIERAYHKAEAAHAGQYRKSGEPYFTHCIAVAHILAEMKLDAEAIAAALMHDLLEDTDTTLEDLRAEFGNTIAVIVDGVTKLKNLPVKAETFDKRGRPTDRGFEHIRKMALAMGDDVRVVLVKLADRLHNMRTLGYMSSYKQQQIAQETLDIYAPLANRLGIWQFKWELEDLSFRYLMPDEYRQLAEKVDERRADRQAYLNSIIETLRPELEKYDIKNALISARPKHIYSIYKKMERKKLPFEQIYDVRAVRVIVDTIPQCYVVLGIVHNLWRPIPGEFDDYIAAPKDNFYQSLHTAVVDSQGKTVEVQIRTMEMHEHAEYGIAAHWRYKEGNTKKRDTAYEERINYLRKLMEFGRDSDDDAASFVDTMKTEVFQDRVYVFTPKGDIVDLPAGATPIDFAYHIHTEIGDRCRGAKVSGRLVNLNYVLKTGDQIEIITSKRGGPSLDWLNPNLGFVATARARQKIRNWFHKQNFEKNIVTGREMVEREMKRLGVNESVSYDTMSRWFNYDKIDDFFAAVGEGDIHGAQLANRILEMEKREEEEQEEFLKARPAAISVDISNGINIMGSSGLLVNMAHCCKPVPGDSIVGYVTRGRGVTVHRADCPNIGAEPERLIDVTWGKSSQEQRYSVAIEIVAYDREGLMLDISTVMADEKVNMSSVNVNVRQNIATLNLTIEIGDMQKLTRILTRLENIPSVTEARRHHVH